MGKQSGNVARGLGDVALPRLQTPEAMLAAIEREVETSAKATLTWRLAQRERQETIGIRGGGAAGTRAEAQHVIAAAKAATSQLQAGRYRDIEEGRQLTAIIKGAYSRLNEILPDALVVILFKSGGPFIYTDSASSDYFRLIRAGSKGKTVWAMGWGPNRSPTYRRYVIDPERVIDTEPVSSSWLLQVWLVLP